MRGTYIRITLSTQVAYHPLFALSSYFLDKSCDAVYRFLTKRERENNYLIRFLRLILDKSLHKWNYRKTHSLQHQRRTKGKVLVFRVTRKIMRLLSIFIQYIYQLFYSRIKLIEWTNLNKMEDKIFTLRIRPIIPMKIRLTFPLLHEQVNIFTYLGRLTLVSPEWSGYMIKNCFSVWGKY